MSLSGFHSQEEDHLQTEQPGPNISYLGRANRSQHRKVQSKSSNSVWIAVFIIIIIYAFTVVYFASAINASNDSSGKTQNGDSRLKEMENRVKSMKTNLAHHIEKSEKQSLVNRQTQQREHQNFVNAIQKIDSNVRVASLAPVTAQNPTPPSPQNNRKSQAHPSLNTNQVNRPKSEYMTAELQQIGEKRQQNAGRIPVAPGTVSQLDPFKKNKDGKGIEQIIYYDSDTRQQRIKFFQERNTYLDANSRYESLKLTKYNLVPDNRLAETQAKDQEEDWLKVNQNFKLEDIKEEIPMCVVVPGYNNNARFRLEYNLNSIFRQNYTNYFAVIINDASTDGSDELFRKYLSHFDIDPERYVYVENAQRKTALENIYTAAHDYCSEDSVLVNLDGDDEFIGRNVLKVFNAGYQQKKAGVLYSNFYWFDQGRRISYGFTSDYSQKEKKDAKYRSAPQRFSHLRSFRTELFRQVPAKDFQDDEGKFFTIAYDMAIYFPVMELACGRTYKIGGYHYLYNINTGLNDYALDRGRQVKVDSKVRKNGHYLACDEKFNTRMEQSEHG